MISRGGFLPNVYLSLCQLTAFQGRDDSSTKPVLAALAVLAAICAWGCTAARLKAGSDVNPTGRVNFQPAHQWDACSDIWTGILEKVYGLWVWLLGPKSNKKEERASLLAVDAHLLFFLLFPAVFIMTTMISRGVVSTCSSLWGRISSLSEVTLGGRAGWRPEGSACVAEPSV